MPEHSQGNGSRRLEQWTVVETVPGQVSRCDHEWRLATLRSTRGKFSPGVHCLRCSAAEPIPESQWADNYRRLERWPQ